MGVLDHRYTEMFISPGTLTKVFTISHKTLPYLLYVLISIPPSGTREEIKITRAYLSEAESPVIDIWLDHVDEVGEITLGPFLVPANSEMNIYVATTSTIQVKIGYLAVLPDTRVEDWIKLRPL